MKIENSKFKIQNNMTKFSFKNLQIKKKYIFKTDRIRGNNKREKRNVNKQYSLKIKRNIKRSITLNKNYNIFKQTYKNYAKQKYELETEFYDMEKMTSNKKFLKLIYLDIFIEMYIHKIIIL